MRVVPEMGMGIGMGMGVGDGMAEEWGEGEKGANLGRSESVNAEGWMGLGGISGLRR